MMVRLHLRQIRCRGSGFASGDEQEVFTFEPAPAAAASGPPVRARSVRAISVTLSESLQALKVSLIGWSRVRGEH